MCRVLLSSAVSIAKVPLPVNDGGVWYGRQVGERRGCLVAGLWYAKSGLRNGPSGERLYEGIAASFIGNHNKGNIIGSGIGVLMGRILLVGALSISKVPLVGSNGTGLSNGREVGECIGQTARIGKRKSGHRSRRNVDGVGSGIGTSAYACYYEGNVELSMLGIAVSGVLSISVLSVAIAPIPLGNLGVLYGRKVLKRHGIPMAGLWSGECGLWNGINGKVLGCGIGTAVGGGYGMSNGVSTGALVIKGSVLGIQGLSIAQIPVVGIDVSWLCDIAGTEEAVAESTGVGHGKRSGRRRGNHYNLSSGIGTSTGSGDYERGIVGSVLWVIVIGVLLVGVLSIAVIPVVCKVTTALNGGSIGKRHGISMAGLWRSVLGIRNGVHGKVLGVCIHATVRRSGSKGNGIGAGCCKIKVGVLLSRSLSIA